VKVRGEWKGQFKIGKLGGRAATMPEIWRTALAA
jgi:hypothetical protein